MPENRKPQHRLDLRNPLVLDTRELGRRAGSMRTVRFPAPAPDDLGVELIGVLPGSEIDLDLRLESVMEGVLVSGTAAVTLTGECGRCLEPVDDTLTVPIQELFAYPDSTTDQTVDEDETARMEGDFLDLEPALRDAVVLALPLTPVCNEDCSGLCAECGERLDDLPEDHRHDASDPRWSGLHDLIDPRTTEEK
ncbi:MAG: YceD family protein [Mycobacteriales bacterium]